MTAKRVVLVAALVAGVGATVYYVASRPASSLVLTGIVTTNDVVVSPLVGGRIERLLVAEGDTVAPGQLLAVIAPDELRADTSYYAHSAEGLSSEVAGAETALRYQRSQTADQIRQAEAVLASAEAQVEEAQATLDNARTTLERNRGLAGYGIITPQDLESSRTAYESASAHVAALKKQVDADRAALSLARATADQVAIKESQVLTERQQFEAATAQRTKADVRLAYAEVHAPLAGFVDVRAVREGEVVNAGQPLLTLINPDDLWVRADVEETYIDRVRLGDRLTVRLPSGLERQGTVFYRGADAAFATARDVSRTKRDIRTFEVRLRVDNRDRRLAVGMTASVLLPIPR
jgi:multidrug resistance efflux pump